MPPDCGGGGGYPMGGPQAQQPNPGMLSHSGPLPSSRLALPPGQVPSSTPGPLAQMGVGRPMIGGYMGGPQGPGSKQQQLYHPGQEFAGMPMHHQPHQMVMGGPPGLGGMQPQGMARTGMPLSGGVGPTVGGSVPGSMGPSPQHLRQALGHHPGGGGLPRMLYNPHHPQHVQHPQQQQHPQSAVWLPHQQVASMSMQRMPCDGRVEPSQTANPHQPLGHAFPGGGGAGAANGINGNPQFSQHAMRSAGGMPGGSGFGPHHQPPSLPPNQGVGGSSLPSRLMQKMGGGVAGQPLPPMVHQGLQQGLRPRGPLSALAGMKPVPPGMTHHPSHPPHGMAPPSYPTSGASRHPHPHQQHPHPHGPGYGQGNPGHKLPQYEHPQPGHSNGVMGGGGGGGGEVDFIETLVGGNEDWLNNLTMIDEYLERNA
ncbi:uncharacterized protein FYW47_015546 [Aplochiton taeniatus]